MLHIIAVFFDKQKQKQNPHILWALGLGHYIKFDKYALNILILYIIIRSYEVSYH